MSKNVYKGPRDGAGAPRADAPGEWIYGRRPVAEVLRAGTRTVYELALPPHVQGEAAELADLRAAARAAGLPVRTLDRDRLDRLCRGGHHQGAAVRVSAFAYTPFEDLLVDAADPSALFVVLDHLTDPQNVGTILRTANAAGATGVIVAEDRACGVTPAAVRASAGASETVRVARVVNVVRAMERLKEAGVWLTGLDFGEDARDYDAVDYTGAAGLVVGAEGEGLSRLARRTCDFVAKLPMLGAVESLNASVASAIAIYEILRQRRRAGGKGRR